MKFDLNKLFGPGGTGGGPNFPSPVELCLATPGAPVCKTLSDALLDQLCSYMPTNPLCPGTGPPPNGGTNYTPPLAGLFGGLQSPGPTTGSSPSSQQPGLLGLLGLGGSP
jgi:hypothetical protein